MYRPEWFDRERSVLEIALDLHMGISGAMDCSEADIENDAKHIQHVLDFWQDSLLKSSKIFDESVRVLLCAAMIEYHKYKLEVCNDQ